MVEKIISAYIVENKRLIVPNFGAFIRGGDGGVRFVELLKNNDGVLISLLCKELSIDEQKATVVINNFIAKIKQNIAIDGEFAISGIGSLTATPEGLYRLIAKPTTPISKIEPIAPKNEEQQQYNEPSIAKQEENHEVQIEKEIKKEAKVEHSKQISKEDTSKKKMDFVMIFAIIIATIALAILVYGFLITNDISIQLPQDDTEQQIIDSSIQPAVKLIN